MLHCNVWTSASDLYMHWFVHICQSSRATFSEWPTEAVIATAGKLMAVYKPGKPRHRTMSKFSLDTINRLSQSHLTGSTSLMKQWNWKTVQLLLFYSLVFGFMFFLFFISVHREALGLLRDHWIKLSWTFEHWSLTLNECLNGWNLTHELATYVNIYESNFLTFSGLAHMSVSQWKFMLLLIR